MARALVMWRQARPRASPVLLEATQQVIAGSALWFPGESCWFGVCFGQLPRHGVAAAVVVVPFLVLSSTHSQIYQFD